MNHGRSTGHDMIEGLKFALIFGLIFGLVLNVISTLIFALYFEPTFRLVLNTIIPGMLYGSFFGLSIGIIRGMIRGLKADIKIRKFPNQGIRESANKAIIITLFSCPLGILSLLFPSLILRDLGSEVAVISSLIQAITTALLIGIYFGGGLACIQHFVLRVILYQSGAIPWNYADFLDYAEELDLIDRVGGRYRFYHDLLREHFAGE